MMNWVIVAHRSELAAPGDFVVLPWTPGCEVAATNMRGHVVAFNNRCPHRGARIYTEPAGNREPRCGYHGRLAMPGGVAALEHGWVGDWLVVCPPGPANTAVPAAIFGLLVGTPPLRLHNALRFVIDCDWRTAVENTLEAEHVPHVHAGSLGLLGLRQTGMELCPDGSSVERFAADGMRLDRLQRFFPGDRRIDYLHAHLAPYTCLSSTRGWTYSLQHYFQRADGRCDFVHRMYAATPARPLPDFFDGAARMNARVFAEDAAICAGIPPGFAGRLGPADARIVHFRKAMESPAA